jgi:hypothetical protein
LLKIARHPEYTPSNPIGDPHRVASTQPNPNPIAQTPNYFTIGPANHAFEAQKPFTV